MTKMIQTELPLPEDCRVRLVDLPVTAGGLIAVDEAGFVNIYLNARLSRDAQLEALQHELRHYYRGDLYSDEDIATVESRADAPMAEDFEGVPPDASPAAFGPEELRPVAHGYYRPTGSGMDRATAHIDGLRALLLRACGIYDVLQTPPLVHRDALMALAGSLDAADIAFVTWQGEGRDRPAVLHFSREDLYGAIYYGPDGAPDNALAIMLVGGTRVTVDVRRRGGRLDVCGITREIGEKLEKLY